MEVLNYYYFFLRFSLLCIAKKSRRQIKLFKQQWRTLFCGFVSCLFSRWYSRARFCFVCLFHSRKKRLQTYSCGAISNPCVEGFSFVLIPFCFGVLIYGRRLIYFPQQHQRASPTASHSCILVFIWWIEGAVYLHVSSQFFTWRAQNDHWTVLNAPSISLLWQALKIH